MNTLLIITISISALLATAHFWFWRERRFLIRQLSYATKDLEESREGYHSYAKIGQTLFNNSSVYELLELILDECQRLSNADGGTLYLLDSEKEHLNFAIMHTNSQGIRQGGTSGNEIKLPPVPLYKGGQPNHANASSHCALTGKTINIKDIYKEKDFDFSGTRMYDSNTGYLSHSMLLMPMKDLEGELIGVIHLINAKDKNSPRLMPFTHNHENLISFLTAHAASTLTNVQLTEQLKELFNSFIRTIASTIDEKSPYTGDHIRRVVNITMRLTEAVNNVEEGPFKDIHFSKEEVNEIRMAAWLHDIGKITTPDGLVNKATKLEIFWDNIHLIECRFNLISELESDPEKKELLNEELKFIQLCNMPSEYMDKAKSTKLESIGKKRYLFKGENHPYLTEMEIEKLSITKGTLTADERVIIENHVAMTRKILEQLPFPPYLARVPDYAAMHHEKLNGTGYMDHLTAEQIPLQARILAVADIFEALTARDRPYRQPIEWDKALGIIRKMADNHELDGDLQELLLSSGVALDYSQEELEK